MKLPVIAALRLEKEGDPDYHAVVISGYGHKNGILKELYIHDDSIGPYCRTLPNGNFSRWKNEWIKREGYKEVLVEKLMVPLYPKIRFGFYSIYYLFLDFKRVLEPYKKMTSELYLMETNQYKKFLWEKSFKDKMEVLCEPFPRFLWVIRRVNINGKVEKDYIFDGTSVYSPPIREILFKN
jgi:hypothetical protein